MYTKLVFHICEDRSEVEAVLQNVKFISGLFNYFSEELIVLSAIGTAACVYLEVDFKASGELC